MAPSISSPSPPQGSSRFAGIQASGLGATPRLSMLLLVGGETLTAEAKPLPKDANSAGAFKSNGRAWLRSCAVAQRRLIDSGAWEFFSPEQPLKVKLDGAIRFESAAMSSFGLRALESTAFAGAKVAAAAAHALSEAPWPPLRRALGDLAGALAQAGERAGERLARLPKSSEPYCDSYFMRDGPEGARGSRHAIVRLPASTEIFDAERGMLALAPFWTPAQVGEFVTLHEVGHAIHHCFGPCKDDFFGTAQAAPGWTLILNQLGFSNLDLSDKFCEAGAKVFSESYADCFAAVSMGAGSAVHAGQRADEILRMRRATIPARMSDYSGGDMGHDSRESLRELATRMGAEDARAPASHLEIHELCMDCARLGLLRWVQSISSQPCGSASGMLWRQAGVLLRLDCNAQARSGLVSGFQASLAELGRLPGMAPLAKEIHGEAAGKAPGEGFAGGVHLLLAAHALAGPPAEPLRGAKQDFVAEGPGIALLGKALERRRSAGSLSPAAATRPS